MRVVTGTEMREIDRRTIKEFGIPSLTLMENAGQAIAERVKVIIAGRGSANVLVVAGTGNNGGDGFVTARLLHESGHPVEVLVTGDEKNVNGDAAANLKKLKGLLSPIFNPTDKDLDSARSNADIAIDAIFGTGFHGKMPDEMVKPICAINHSGAYVVSIDIPSGVDADTGRTGGVVVEADETITFGAPKLGCLMYPGAAYIGQLTIESIGFPAALTDKAGHIESPTAEEMATLLPLRNPNGHKKSMGRVLVVAGSAGMTGAAAMCAMSALRAGAGIVTLAVPESLNDILAVKLTEVMTKGLPETEESCLSMLAAPVIFELIKQHDLMILGPGLGKDFETIDTIRRVAAGSAIPMVLDADGINAFAGEAHFLKARPGEYIITPHPGELAVLTGLDAKDIEKDRLAAAASAAAETSSVVVLKGANSIVCAPDQRISINSTGNSGMATAGSGDVLAGLIGGLWTQHMSAPEAAILGTYLHGLAGDMAVTDLTEYSLVAGDLIEYIPDAFRATIEAGIRPEIKSEE